MKNIWPHELFRLDFDQILEEGKRQEEIYPQNIGEFAIVADLHSFFSDDVLPVIVINDWVYEATKKFANEYAKDSFRNLRLSGQEIYETQRKLLDVKEQVIDFLARASLAGYASLEGITHLTKASDFIEILEFDKLNNNLKKQALELSGRAKDHEDLQVRVVLRGIGDCYELVFTRIMYVTRRAMKVKAGKSPANSDVTLQEPLNYIGWLASNTNNNHILNKIIVQQREFYRSARNVGNHHLGLQWKPDNNEIILPDRKNTVSIHVDEFHQKFRHLVHFCDLGVRGILSAFCERERGEISNDLVKEYDRTFPSDWSGGKEGTITLYP